MKQTLTDKTIPKLLKDAIPNSGSVIVWDKGKRGFGLRLTAGGVASFILNYRDAEGRERRFTIGRWGDNEDEYTADAAYFKAGELRKAIKTGADPFELRKAKAVVETHDERTLNDAAKDYLEEYAAVEKRRSSYRNDRNMLQNVVLPRLGTMPLSQIRKKNMEELRNTLKGTPYLANRVLSLLSTIFNRVIAQDADAAEHYDGEEQVRWITVNPASTKRLERFKERKRKVWLSVEQLDALKKAIDEYPSQDIANIIRLQLLTGSRIGEVLSAEWSEFDLKRGIWNKPALKTKQDEDEYLALGSRTVELVKKMAESKNGSPYLFPGNVKSPDGKKTHRGYIKWAWMQICKAAGLAEEYKVRGKGKYKDKEFSRWRPLYRTHDLRHTFASHLVSNGESLPTIGKLVGHKNSKTTERYAHLAENAQKKAADHFAEIVGW
jgi:integrase